MIKRQDQKVFFFQDQKVFFLKYEEDKVLLHMKSLSHYQPPCSSESICCSYCYSCSAFPLHLAAANQAELEVVRALLREYPEAARERDLVRGRTVTRTHTHTHTHV